jgi:hypothetical protein
LQAEPIRRQMMVDNEATDGDAMASMGGSVPTMSPENAAAAEAALK